MMWLWLACSSVEKDPLEGVVDPGAGQDTGYSSLPDIDQNMLEPSLTADQVAEQLTNALRDLPDPEETIETYLFLMSQGDEICPGSEYVITDSWLHGCEATTGYTYAGISDWIVDSFEVQGQIVELNVVAGDFFIETPEGHRLDVGGRSALLSNSDMWFGELIGSWRFDQGSPWLVHGFSGHLKVEVIRDIRSSLQGAIDINGTYIAARNLVFTSVCDFEPMGGLSLRDENGGWYRMDFTECNHCSTVTFEGTHMGEACVDFGPLLETLGDHL